MSGVNLSVNLGPLRLQNPVLVASGTFGYGSEYADLVDLNRLGGIMVKGTTLHPRVGNPMPRMVETAAGCLNSIGLQNVGVEAFIREKLPFLRRYRCAVIVNIAGDSYEEFEQLAERLDGVDGVHALEMNISCPNQEKGGIHFGVDPEATREVVSRVRRRTRLPLMVKLSPNVTDITVTARAAVDGGADILSLVNTFVGTAIDAKTRRFKLANVTGGLSGPAIKPLALYMVWRVAQTVKVPIIGMGGIMNATDAVEFLLAGASAIAIGTANYVNPRVSIEVVEGIERYLLEQGERDVQDIVGTVKRCKPESEF
ncbi:MAG: dihydroorotate dehydrogenase [Firmicutes bacterium]|nr:dihydroorotate dehydrogenase [Bacillota bacterium]